MTVKVITSSPPPGGSAALSFTDNFTRANGSPGTNYHAATIADSDFAIVGNQLTCKCAANNPMSAICLVPTGLIESQFQYIEAVFISGAGSYQCGLGTNFAGRVMRAGGGVASGLQGYFAEVSGGQIFLARCTPGDPHSGPGGAIGAIAGGDVLGVQSITPDTIDPTQDRTRVFLNGVLIDDTLWSPLLSSFSPAPWCRGLPGFYSLDTGLVTWSNLEVRALP